MKKIEFQTIIKKLQGLKLPKVDLVVGLETGGIVPAALVGSYLRKPVVFMSINYRDETNAPQHARPILLRPFARFKKKLRVLIVDDVSVTGQTLKLARKMLKPCSVKTFVLKGQADQVLFPKIKECVKWPWKP
jgi:adenine/guanine phosphoribosyltransferase-like PRPP-binding protein